MIVGRFDEQSGLPLIEGYLVLPRLQIYGYINFIMDTGADRTLLLPTDALSLGIDYENFSATSNTIGIGGMAEVHEESVQLAFIDGNVAHLYNIEISICRPSAELMNFPSLLGRDIINSGV